MKIYNISASVIADSRGEETIEIIVNNIKESRASAPSGKSKGKHEKFSYIISIHEDIKELQKTDFRNIEIKEFEDLSKIEKKLKDKVGANTLFALEAAILKALASEQKIELWQLLNPLARVFPRILSNTIGGGAHSSGKKPDFQEFLITNNKNPAISKVINRDANEEARAVLKGLSGKNPMRNDENAWQAEFNNEKTLEIMKNIEEDIFEETGIHLDIGLDIAASQFFKKGKYYYMNEKKTRSRKQQIKYIIELAKAYNIFYIEDPLDEEDFRGFAELRKNLPHCIITGDDLTVTNLERVQKAIKMRAINGLIVKPNQTGSLLEVKKIIDLCKRNNIYVIFSHRSGETADNSIADLAFAWQADFIKTPVIGREREAKVDRLVEIERWIQNRI